MAGFQTTFHDHSRFSEQLLESQAATWKTEQAPWSGLLEEFSQLVFDFKEADRKIILQVHHKKQPNMWKPSVLIQKVLF